LCYNNANKKEFPFNIYLGSNISRIHAINYVGLNK
jgi:hypothetical protein